MFSDHNFGKTHIKPLPSFILHAMNADDAYKPIQRATLSEASWRILRIAQSVELRHPVSHETALAIWGVELPADSDCSVVSLRSSQGGYAGTDVDYGWSGESPAFGHSEHSIRLGQDFPDSDFQYFPDSQAVSRIRFQVFGSRLLSLPNSRNPRRNFIRSPNRRLVAAV